MTVNISEHDTLSAAEEHGLQNERETEFLELLRQLDEVQQDDIIRFMTAYARSPR